MKPSSAFAVSVLHIVRVEVRADQLNPMYAGDLNHVFVKPEIDLTQLPGFDEKRLPKPKSVDDLPKSSTLTKEFDQRAAPQIQ